MSKTTMNLSAFLDKKPLFYDEIDYTRMPKAYASIATYLRIPKIIHLVGTNGKGTTGRFLAEMLRTQKCSVGHYTSPHIIDFNERVWLNGAPVTDDVLEVYHQTLLSWLSAEMAEALSYFEYTTLLAMAIFSQTCDYVVFEAGLGGEFDATNSFPKILSVITPIGYDHQAFLGNSIEEIATTKLNSITTDFVLASQYEPTVIALAQKQAKKVNVTCYESYKYFSKQRQKDIAIFSKKWALSPFLMSNFTTAFCALTVLGYDIDLERFEPAVLPGRYQRVAPNVTLDVGHNEMAAHALVQAFAGKKVHLIYNSYKDKDYATILKILKPIVEEILIIPIDSPRAVDVACVYDVANELHIPISSFKSLETTKEYLVFGSFSVAEAFIKGRGEK